MSKLMIVTLLALVLAVAIVSGAPATPRSGDDGLKSLLDSKSRRALYKAFLVDDILLVTLAELLLGKTQDAKYDLVEGRPNVLDAFTFQN